MKKFIFIFLSIICFNLQATDLTDKLKSCFEDKRFQINHEKELESLKAVSSCLTDFVQNLEDKSEAKTNVTNPVSIQFNLQNMYPMSFPNYSSFVDIASNRYTNPYLHSTYGEYSFNLGSAGSIGNANLFSSTNFLAPAIYLPGIVQLGSEADGNTNVYYGSNAFNSGNNTGSNNVIYGAAALYDNTSGNENIAIGNSSLNNNTTGDFNSAVGFRSLWLNTTGEHNTALGHKALQDNRTGNSNVAVGRTSLDANTSGANSTALGTDALSSNTTGSNNTASGFQAGFSNLTGSNNVFIGHKAGYNETGSNKLYISNSATQDLLSGDFSTGYISLGRAGLANGGIGIYGDLGAQFMDDDASNYVALVAPTSISSNITWTLPGTDGTNGQVLSTDGSGTLSWSTVSSGSSQDTNTFLESASLDGSNLVLTMSDNETRTVDISSVSSGSNQDTNTFLESASLDGSNLVLTMSDNKTRTVDLKGVSQVNTESIENNSNSIAQNATNIALSTTEIASLGFNLNNFKQVTSENLSFMKSDYSSGIASAIAIGQISIADEGFSIGVGHGRYNGQGEQVFGLGFGGSLKDGTRYKLQATKNKSASGFGFTISY